MTVSLLLFFDFFVIVNPCAMEEGNPMMRHLLQASREAETLFFINKDRYRHLNSSIDL